MSILLGKIDRVFQALLIATLKMYKLMISPLLPKSCRFYPSCSDYCMQAISKYGSIKGLLMGIARVARCNQFFSGGYDPLK